MTSDYLKSQFINIGFTDVMSTKAALGTMTKLQNQFRNRHRDLPCFFVTDKKVTLITTDLDCNESIK